MLVTAVLALAFQLNEMSGYRIFDAEHGGNILCDLDPTCRQLSDEEKYSVTEYFGDQVDARYVKVFSRRQFFVMGNNYAAAAVGNNLYEGRHYKPLKDDPIALKSVFLHEMTHIWQEQNDLKRGFIKKVFSADPRSNDIEEVDNFLHLSAEGQANFIMVLYQIREFAKNANDDGQKALACEELRKIETVAEKLLPISKLPQCDLNESESL